MKLVFIGIVNEKIFGVENQPCIKKPENRNRAFAWLGCAMPPKG